MKEIAQSGGEILYEAACELLAAPIVFYYVLDEEFQPSGVYERITRWIFDAEELAQRLHDDNPRAGTLGSYEAVIDAYLDYAYKMLAKASTQANRECESISKDLWFYYLYCRWYLELLNTFEKIVHSEPIFRSVDYQAYKSNSRMFEEIKSRLHREKSEYAGLTDAEKCSQPRAHSILESTVHELTQRWIETVAELSNN